jgi:hypothetical protein
VLGIPDSVDYKCMFSRNNVTVGLNVSQG